MSLYNLIHYLIILVELFLFTGFIWVITRWFKKGNEIKRWELPIIKTAGLVFIIAHLITAIFYSSQSQTLSAVGLGLLLLSALVFLLSIFSFKKEKPAVAFSHTILTPLKTTGIYKFIRHPFYTSYSLAWLAGTIATQYWLLILSFILMFFIYWRAAKLEERQWLASSAADDYKNYKQQTGMFLPKYSFINVVILIAVIAVALILLHVLGLFPIEITEIHLLIQEI